MDRHHFQERTREDFRTILLEPTSKRLAQFADLFEKRALENKQILFMILQQADYSRAYERHKDRAIKDLKKVYAEFRAELDKTIERLDEKEKRFFF
jgi:hypothetical protein